MHQVLPRTLRLHPRVILAGLAVFGLITVGGTALASAASVTAISASSPQISATGRLTVPTNVHKSAVTATSDTLSWNQVPGATSYLVQLKSGTANGTQVVAPTQIVPALTSPGVVFSPLVTDTSYTALIWPSNAPITGGPINLANQPLNLMRNSASLRDN